MINLQKILDKKKVSWNPLTHHIASDQNLMSPFKNKNKTNIKKIILFVTQNFTETNTIMTMLVMKLVLTAH